MKSSSILHLMLRCFLGCFLTVLTIWVVGIYFCRNYSPQYFEESLKRNLWKPGCVVHMTKEGFADTVIGKDGAIAPDGDWESSDEIILLLGNSFVEGFHVADGQKIHRQINRQLAQAEIKARVVNVGMSAQSIADNLWQLPHYLEKYGNRIRAVVIVLAGGSCVMRPEPGEYSVGGYCSPDGTMVFVPPHKLFVTKFGELKYTWKLNSFLVLGHKAKTIRMNFIPGPHAVPPAPEVKTYSREETVKYQNAWLDYLRRTTTLPTLLVWAEHPVIQDGNITPAVYSDEFAVVRDGARGRGIDFIDLTMDFNNFALQNKKMVTGLLNTPPGVGHWNEYGHKIAGDEIFRWCCRVVANTENGEEK